MYHTEVLDSYPKGEVFLGQVPDYRVSIGGFGEEKDNRLAFTVNTPSRFGILTNLSDECLHNLIMNNK